MGSDSKGRYRPKTGDLATPPRDRLIPVSDVARLFGCTENEIEALADHMGLVLEPLTWRGVFLTSLTLADTLQLHLAMRTPVASAEADPEMRELAQARDREALLRKQAEAALSALEARLAAREREWKGWSDRLNDLELIVAERGRIERELEALRAQFGEADARRRELAQQLQISEENRLLLIKMQSAESALRAKQEQEALQNEWLALRDRGRRKRIAERLRTFRRTLDQANLLERNLENYCDRLEQRLLDHGVTPLPKSDWEGSGLNDWPDYERPT